MLFGSLTSATPDLPSAASPIRRPRGPPAAASSLLGASWVVIRVPLRAPFRGSIGILVVSYKGSFKGPF